MKRVLALEDALHYFDDDDAPATVRAPPRVVLPRVGGEARVESARRKHCGEMSAYVYTALLSRA